MEATADGEVEGMQVEGGDADDAAAAAAVGDELGLSDLEEPEEDAEAAEAAENGRPGDAGEGSSDEEVETIVEASLYSCCEGVHGRGAWTCTGDVCRRAQPGGRHFHLGCKPAGDKKRIGADDRCRECYDALRATLDAGSNGARRSSRHNNS